MTFAHVIDEKGFLRRKESICLIVVSLLQFISDAVTTGVTNIVVLDRYGYKRLWVEEF